MQVQIIPWIISDSNYVRCPSYQLDPAKTVFVGALHGTLSAEGLASIMNDLFGGVVYSGKLPGVPRTNYSIKKNFCTAACYEKLKIENALGCRKLNHIIIVCTGNVCNLPLSTERER